jgi:integrase
MMLQQKVEEYIALRRATGFKFRDADILLHNFVKFAAARGDRVVRSKTAIAWASLTKKQQRRAARLRIVTRLSEYLRAEDTRHELPPQNVFYAGARVRPSPHIFSEEDISRIVAQAAQLGPKGSLRPLTYSTLFGLLAVSGLRVSEATNLRFTDITRDGLLIRETKFRKSRLVPLHETTMAALERYVRARRRVAAETDHVFVSRHRRKLHNNTVLLTFRQVCERADVARTVTGAHTRVHDLRHTFAVHALERCPVGRDRVEKHMIALMTYLGHARVESTYWYLERTPRLLMDIATACEAIVPGAGR